MFCDSVRAVLNREIWFCPRDRHMEVYRVPRTLEPTLENNDRFMLVHPRLKKPHYFETHVDLAKSIVLVGKCEGCRHRNRGDFVLIDPSGNAETTADAQPQYGLSPLEPYMQARVQQQKLLNKLAERQQELANRMRARSKED